MSNTERTRLRLFSLGATSDELKVPRPLSIEEWKAMSPELQAYHLEANGREVQKMDEAEAKKATEAAQNADADVDRFFGQAMQEEVNSTLEVAARWCRRHPQFVQIESNTEKMLAWFKAHRRAKPNMDDFTEAFCDLCRSGAVSIDLEKIGESGGVISGWELKHSPVLYKILAPVAMTATEKKQKEIDSMSADEFLKASPELHEKRISPIFKAQFDKAVATLESFHPEYQRTDANNKILLDHIGKHQAGLPFDSTQLLAAFDAVKDQLELKSNVASHGATRVVEYELLSII